MSTRTRLACSILLGTAIVAGLAPAASASRTGIGDPYYPTDGNGGYDVRSYRIAADYQPGGHTIQGRTTVRAEAIAGIFLAAYLGLVVPVVGLGIAAQLIDLDAGLVGLSAVLLAVIVVAVLGLAHTRAESP